MVKGRRKIVESGRNLKCFGNWQVATKNYANSANRIDENEIPSVMSSQSVLTFHLIVKAFSLYGL